ncbi:unnamed protein product, partial [Ceratitis capitata]
ITTANCDLISSLSFLVTFLFTSACEESLNINITQYYTSKIIRKDKTTSWAHKSLPTKISELPANH